MTSGNIFHFALTGAPCEAGIQQCSIYQEIRRHLLLVRKEQLPVEAVLKLGDSFSEGETTILHLVIDEGERAVLFAQPVPENMTDFLYSAEKILFVFRCGDVACGFVSTLDKLLADNSFTTFFPALLYRNDRRRFHRVATVKSAMIYAVITGNGRKEKIPVGNIGLGGLLFNASPSIVTEQQECEIRLIFPDESVFPATVRIILSDDTGVFRGEFKNLSEEVSEKIDTYICDRQIISIESFRKP